ncbi:hypothetical protein H9P43_003778 [Blastocladiella emersonii ATCC 22665]|nr:hypothetical protein H9P43_003778 [Blastocladiella emersonii ATCC 22665]
MYRFSRLSRLTRAPVLARVARLASPIVAQAVQLQAGALSRRHALPHQHFVRFATTTAQQTPVASELLLDLEHVGTAINVYHAAGFEKEKAVKNLSWLNDASKCTPAAFDALLDEFAKLPSWADSVDDEWCNGVNEAVLRLVKLEGIKDIAASRPDLITKLAIIAGKRRLENDAVRAVVDLVAAAGNRAEAILPLYAEVYRTLGPSPVKTMAAAAVGLTPLDRVRIEATTTYDDARVRQIVDRAVADGLISHKWADPVLNFAQIDVIHDPAVPYSFRRLEKMVAAKLKEAPGSRNSVALTREMFSMFGYCANNELRHTFYDANQAAVLAGRVGLDLTTRAKYQMSNTSSASTELNEIALHYLGERGDKLPVVSWRVLVAVMDAHLYSKGIRDYGKLDDLHRHALSLQHPNVLTPEYYHYFVTWIKLQHVHANNKQHEEEREFDEWCVSEAVRLVDEMLGLGIQPLDATINFLAKLGHEADFPQLLEAASRCRAKLAT